MSNQPQNPFQQMQRPQRPQRPSPQQNFTQQQRPQQQPQQPQARAQQNLNIRMTKPPEVVTVQKQNAENMFNTYDSMSNLCICQTVVNQYGTDKMNKRLLSRIQSACADYARDVYLQMQKM